VALATLLKGDNQGSIACGGVAALVGLLAPSWTDAVHEQAAAALWDLCAKNTQNRDSVRECGGVAALVALLAPGGTRAVLKQAVGALCCLCFANVQNKNSVRASGGVAALIALPAPGGSAAVQEQAAAALRNLCVDNAQNRECVRECRGVAALVGLLAPGGPVAVQEQAAAALRNLCCDNAQNRDGVRECGGVAALVALLAPGGSAAVRARAAAALHNLCYENTKNKDCVRWCGGVGALVGLLAPGGSAEMHVSAVGALMNPEAVARAAAALSSPGRPSQRRPELGSRPAAGRARGRRAGAPAHLAGVVNVPDEEAPLDQALHGLLQLRRKRLLLRELVDDLRARPASHPPLSAPPFRTAPSTHRQAASASARHSIRAAATDPPARAEGAAAWHARGRLGAGGRT